MKVTRRNQKKIFLWCTGIFMVLVLYASYDIASRTTFPGMKKQVEDGAFTVEEGDQEGNGAEAMEVPAVSADSLGNDTGSEK